MKKNKINVFFFLVSISLVFLYTSCSKEQIDLRANSIEKERDKDKVQFMKHVANLIPYYGPPLNPTILGNPKNNPYTLAVMEEAFSEIANLGFESQNPVDIRVTHQYVKFMPETYDELDLLENDERLILYDHPLDYEIVETGDYYREENIGEDQPTYYYASVPITYSFDPQVSYVILEKLYLPEEDPILLGPDLNENLDYLDHLLDKAYELTRNFDDVLGLNRSVNSNRYHPAGQVRVFDTRLAAFVGVRGAKACARRWFTTKTAMTNSNGSYTMSGTFRRACHQTIFFKDFTNRFVVKNHWLSKAKCTQSKTKSDFNLSLTPGMYHAFAANIFRAAHRVSWQGASGFTSQLFGNNPVLIAKNSNKVGPGINYAIYPYIKISRYDDNNDEYMSDEIFSSTVHELAHSIHVDHMNTAIQYAQVDPMIQESFCIGAEWVMTRAEYVSRGISNYGDETYYPPNPPQYPGSYAYQYWNNSTTFGQKYTNLFINLIDNFNELNQTFPSEGNGTVSDQVAGYTINDILNDVLKHSYGVSSLSTELKANKPNGVTDADIDLLLSHY